MKKKTIIRTGSLIAGIITALAVVVSQFFFFEAPGHGKKSVATEQAENPSDSPEEDLFYTLPSTTLPTSAHVEIQQETFCLFEILFEDPEFESDDTRVSLPVSHYLQTLLEVIISPNAP